MATTATVQLTVNYVPQCFNAYVPYSVLSRSIIIRSMDSALRNNLIYAFHDLERIFNIYFLWPIKNDGFALISFLKI